MPPKYSGRSLNATEIPWPLSECHGNTVAAPQMPRKYRGRLDTWGTTGLTTDMDAGELTMTARMARLSLSEQELERLRTAVEQMLAHFSHMREIDVEGLAPTTHALLHENRLREDVEIARIAPDALIGNAPEREERFIVIPNVL
jgi:aspartyl-tRNA(Asn)/glutamyl-tRNA(Gln) amidotransferase subunit C